MQTALENYHLVNIEDEDEFGVAVDAVADGATRNFLRGVRADRADDFESAKSFYEAAIASPRTHPYISLNAPVRLVYCLMQLGEGDSAIILGEEQLLRFQTVTPHPLDEETELKSILANLYSGRGEFTRAISLTAAKPPRTETGVLLAQWGWSRSVVLFHAGLVREALECGLEAAAAIDRNAHPHLFAGIDDNNNWMRCVLGERFSDEEMDDLSRRAEDLRRARRDTALSEIELVTGYAYANRNELGEARAVVNRLIERPSLSGPGLVRAATVLEASGDSDGAAELYRKSIDLIDMNTEPFLIAAVWNKMSRLHEASGDSESALTCLRAAIEVVGVVGTPDADPYCISI